jgi:hypothetical protein
MISRPKTIRVADMLSTDLALRDTATRLILYADGLANPQVILDFSNVRSVTRSFAHEYCIRKREARKRIREENVPENVAKMFAVAQAVRVHSPIRSRINFDNIPVINL